MSDTATYLARYRAFLEKVDAKFNEIHERNAGRMQCGHGCHACCVPKLTVFSIEKENLKALLLGTPGLVDKLRALEKENPHHGTRCRFLERDGSCAVYEARPLVCRSHGAPLFSKQGEQTILDVCPLNFDDVRALTELANADFMNLDLLNTLLAALNREVDPGGERTALAVDAILK